MVRANVLDTDKVPNDMPPFAKTQSPKSFLYSSVLKKFIGEQAAYVFSLLLTNERLSLRRLGQLSRLKPTQLRKTLAILIQMNCVVYYHKSGSADGSKSYYYYPNEEGCLKLVYADDIIRTIGVEYDEDAATIVQNVLAVGHLTPSEFLSQINDAETYIKSFNVLTRDGWLIPVQKHMFENQFDLFNQTLKKVVTQYNSENPVSKTLSQTKRIAGIKQIAAEQYLKTIQLPAARRHLEDTELDSPLTFNLERYFKRLRSRHLASDARHRVGDISAKVYRLILHHIEAHSRDVRCKDSLIDHILANFGQSTVGFDPLDNEELRRRLELQDQMTGLSVNVADVQKELEQSGVEFGISQQDIIGTIYDSSDLKRVAEQPSTPSKRAKNATKVKLEDTAEFSATEHNITKLLLQHMKLLCTDSRIPFLREVSPGTFYVPFTEIVPAYRDYTFKQYIRQILGPQCLRIYNCIEEKHLTDEKTLAKLVLMRESDIRTDLNRMQRFGLVEFQEIPKTQDRSAMRATYTFRVRPDTGVHDLFSALVYNMGEVLERLEVLRLNNRILLDKVSRDDVRGKEDQLLLSSELEQLHKYYDNERTAVAKLTRLRSAMDVLGFMLI